MRQREDFEEFYQANYRRLVAILYAVLGDRQEAEDAVQEAFARAYLRWPRLSGYDLPEIWVRRVALRIGIDSGRRWRRRLGTMAKLLNTRQPDQAEPSDALPLHDDRRLTAISAERADHRELPAIVLERHKGAVGTLSTDHLSDHVHPVGSA